MARSQFQDRLQREFEDRRRKNTRYSLRAFATFLGTDHSTLSQIFRDKRRIPAIQLRRWGKKLGLMEEEIAVYVATQHVPELSVTHRQEQLRHWTAEASAILSDRSHWQIIHLLHSPAFQADCRWIAQKISCTVDEVNVALSRLLRLQMLAMGRTGRWKDLTGCGERTEAEFQKRALVKIRELAADDGVELRGVKNKPVK
jgi:transcriptional regulator with XRE-family HTH domain